MLGARAESEDWSSAAALRTSASGCVARSVIKHGLSELLRMFGSKWGGSLGVLNQTMALGWLSGRNKVHRTVTDEVASANFL